MTDYYINSDTGVDVTNSGTSGSPWQSISYAISQMANDDRLLLQAASAAYVMTAQETLGSSLQRFKMSAVDGVGTICADDPANFNRGDMLPGAYGDMALVEMNFSGGGFRQSHQDQMEFHGIIFDGLNTAQEAYFSTTSNALVLFQVCVVRNFTVRGLRVRESTCREVGFFDNTEAFETVESPNTFESCVWAGNDGTSTAAIDKFNATYTLFLRNCTFYQNRGGAFAYCIDNPQSNVTFENCLLVDGDCGYGLPGSIQTTGNCYTSDGATYHTQANYNGATDANDLEEDPDFEDAASGDFHINNATLQTGGTSNAVPRLYDGTPMPANTPIGALAGPAAPPSSPKNLPPEDDVSAMGMFLDGLQSLSPSVSIFPPPNEWSGKSLTELEAAVPISLQTDRRVESYELPDDMTGRIGWWGDSFSEIPWGSKLHLLERAKITAEAPDVEAPNVATPAKAVEYIDQATEWAVADGVATEVDIDVERTFEGDKPTGLAGEVTLVRGRSEEPVVTRFDSLWEALING